MELQSDDPGRMAVETLHRKLNAYLKTHGLRSTAQRRLVTDVFFRTRGHLTVEDLLTKVIKKDSGVGYATVYRTLKLLADSRLAAARHFGDGFTRYEVADIDGHHDHLICVDCGRIEEFEDDAIEMLQARVAERSEFKLQSHKLELYGSCRDCTNLANSED
jgi:Fur family ferric uptake transcriptional regulator